MAGRWVRGVLAVALGAGAVVVSADQARAEAWSTDDSAGDAPVCEADVTGVTFDFQRDALVVSASFACASDPTQPNWADGFVAMWNVDDGPASDDGDFIVEYRGEQSFPRCTRTSVATGSTRSCDFALVRTGTNDVGLRIPAAGLPMSDAEQARVRFAMVRDGWSEPDDVDSAPEGDAWSPFLTRPPWRVGYVMVTKGATTYSFTDPTSYPVRRGTLGVDGVVDIELTPRGDGWWIVTEQGHVYTRGTATYFGGNPNLGAGETVTSLASSDGAGYWLFTSKGRVFPFGDARFFGDMSSTPLNGPVLDSIPTPSAAGYYMVASDGGIFTFGDAVFRGSMGATPLNAPVQSLVPVPDGGGYWLVASDGGIFTFGSAPFYGSMGHTRLNKPVTGMVGSGTGYVMVAEDGGVFTFGSAPFYGSLGQDPPREAVVAVDVMPATA